MLGYVWAILGVFSILSYREIPRGEKINICHKSAKNHKNYLNILILLEIIGLYMKIKSKWVYLQYLSIFHNNFTKKIPDLRENWPNSGFLIFNEKSIDSTNFHPIWVKFGTGHLLNGIPNPNLGIFDFCIFCHFMAPKSWKIAVFGQKVTFLKIRRAVKSEKMKISKNPKLGF